MSKNKQKSANLNPKPKEYDRLIDLLERIGSLELYLNTELDHHAIAKRLGMGTQRVNDILKGLKKKK